MARKIGRAAGVIACAFLFGFIGSAFAQSGGDHGKAPAATKLNSSKSNTARGATKNSAAAKKSSIVKSKSNITNN